MITKRNVMLLAATAAIALPGATAVAGPGDHGHDHGGNTMDEHGKEVTARPGTSVSIRVKKDRFTGWNLLIETKRFRFAPERASESHRLGEGHAHLSIDGKPVTRLYGKGYYIAKLAPGRHKLRVALATNSHAEYVDARGKPIADSATVRVRK